MDVIIVCHTEFGFVSDKKIIYDKKAKSGVQIGVVNLVRVAEKHGAKVSFAVCPEVAEYFPKKIHHEIGLHVHPGWETLPEAGNDIYIGDAYLRKHCKQSGSSSLLWDYSYEEQFGMIKTGKEYLIERLNITPKFFVAGRWCLNNDTVKALIANNFTHDCSAPAHVVSAHHNWSELPRMCPPYYPDKDNYQKKGNLPLLIIPVSQFLPYGNVNPEDLPKVGLPWLKACFLEYYRQDLPVFHICLHSPCMTDEYFISGLDNLLSFISKHHNVNFKFVSEIKEYPPITPKTNVVPYIFALNKDILKIFFRKLTHARFF